MAEFRPLTPDEHARLRGEPVGGLRPITPSEEMAMASAKRTAKAGERAIEEQEHLRQYPYGFGSAILQGATFGLADELKGAVRPGTSEDYRQSQETYGREHPVRALIGELLGGGGLAGASRRLLRAAPAALGRLAAEIPKSTPVAAAGVGATYGAGAAPPGERLQGAAVGGVGGLTAGLAASGAGAGIRYGQAFVRPQQYLNRRLREAAEADVLSPAELSRLTAKPGTSIADVGGENLRRLAMQAAGQPGAARTQLMSGLNQHAAQLAEDAKTSLQSAFGPQEFFAERQQLGARLGSEARPLYETAYAANPSIVSKEISRALDTPAGRAALRKAAEAVRNEFGLVARPDPELTQALREAVELGKAIPSPGGVSKGLTLRTLDYVKRVLDSEIRDIRNAMEKGNRAESYRLAGLENVVQTLVDEVDKFDASGGVYKQARDVWRGNKATLDALDFGTKFLRVAPEEISAALESMSAAEQKAFRIGAGRALMDVVERGGTEQKLTRSAYIGRQIEAALPPADFEVVVNSVISAGRARQLAKEVGGAYGQTVPADPRLSKALGRVGALVGSQVPGTHSLIGAGVGRQIATAAAPVPQTGQLAAQLLTPEGAPAALRAMQRSGLVNDRTLRLIAQAIAQQAGLAQ